MAGRPQGAMARTVQVQVRMTRVGVESLDRRRGALTRSAYLRRLLEQDAQDGRPEDR